MAIYTIINDNDETMEPHSIQSKMEEGRNPFSKTVLLKV